MASRKPITDHGLKHKKVIARRRASVQRWFDQTSLAQSMPQHAPEIVEAICTHMLETGDGMTKICRQQLVPGAPDPATLLFWRRCDPRINAALTAARQARAEMRWEEMEEKIEEIFEEAVTLGDKASLMAASQRAKLLYETRKFEVSRLLSSIYGDAGDKKLAQEAFDARAKTVQEAVERMEKDGKVVLPGRVLEIPAKEAPKPTPKLHAVGDDD